MGRLRVTSPLHVIRWIPLYQPIQGNRAAAIHRRRTFPDVQRAAGWHVIRRCLGVRRNVSPNDVERSNKPCPVPGSSFPLLFLCSPPSHPPPPRSSLFVCSPSPFGVEKRHPFQVDASVLSISSRRCVRLLVHFARRVSSWFCIPGRSHY